MNMLFVIVTFIFIFIIACVLCEWLVFEQIGGVNAFLIVLLVVIIYCALVFFGGIL